MKEKTFSSILVTVYSLLLFIFLFVLIVIPYSTYTGIDIYFKVMTGDRDIFFLALIFIFFFHDLIPVFVFCLFTKKKFKSIRLGVRWSRLSIYFYCKAFFPLRQYRIAIILPVLLVGILPLIIALFFQWTHLLLFSIIFISNRIEDLIFLWMTRNISKDNLIYPHPYKHGFSYGMG